jgi:hypothetical protein
MYYVEMTFSQMEEICEGLKALSGKLNHLGLQKTSAKSTAGDGLRRRI